MAGVIEFGPSCPALSRGGYMVMCATCMLQCIPWHLRMWFSLVQHLCLSWGTYLSWYLNAGIAFILQSLLLLLFFFFFLHLGWPTPLSFYSLQLQLLVAHCHHLIIATPVFTPRLFQPHSNFGGSKTITAFSTLNFSLLLIRKIKAGR